MGTYLGQNFLTDSKIRHYLGAKTEALYKDFGCTGLIEIGPGKGSLTKLIRDISPNFFVIEKDDKLITEGKLKVEGLEDIHVIHADVLDVDIEEELAIRFLNTNTTLIVGNLPYYITSPILRRFFGVGRHTYAGGVFMVQKEVADKLCKDARKKSYLRWIINYAYEVIYLKTVPAKAFSPAPKVTSALIELKRNPDIPHIHLEKLGIFLDDFSPYSRKTLGAIGTMLQKKHHKNWNIPLDLKSKRLEQLDWIDLEHILE